MWNTVKSNWKFLFVCVCAYIMVFLILNYIETDEKIINIAEFGLSVIIFFVGFFHNDKTFKCEILNNKREQYKTISSAIANIQDALNIKSKQLTLLRSLNPHMDINPSMQSILSIIEKIDNANVQYNAISSMISDSYSKEEFEKCVSVLTVSFKTVLENLQGILSEWGDLISYAEHAKESTQMLNTDDNKLNFVSIANHQREQMDMYKRKYLKLYDEQLPQLSSLISDLNLKAQMLLDEEYAIIDQLELHT